MNEEPPPVQQSIVVPLTADDAFALFTEGLASWWPFKTHSCAGEDALDVQFEPRVGGAVTELDRAGRRHPWGVVTAWAPPRHFAMTWHPAQSPEQATTLSVHFTAVNGGCEVALEHGGWGGRGDEAGDVRDGYQKGWTHVLGRYGEQSKKEKAP
jgi:hypothetical protein